MEWAYSWVLTSAESYLGTPAARCEREFEQLFATRYQERFGPDGLRLTKGGGKVSLQYRTVNHALPDLSQATDLPDAAAAPETIEALRGLALDCCAGWMPTAAGWDGTPTVATPSKLWRFCPPLFWRAPISRSSPR